MVAKVTMVGNANDGAMVMFQRLHLRQHLPFLFRVLRKTLAFRLFYPIFNVLLQTFALNPSALVHPLHPSPVARVTLYRRSLLCGVGERALRCQVMVLLVRHRSPRQPEALEK